MPSSTKKRAPKGRAICKQYGCLSNIHRKGYCSKHDYQRNKELYVKKGKKYYQANRKARIAQGIIYHNANKDIINEKNKKRYRKDINKSRKMARGYYQKNKVKLAASEKKRYWAERELRCQRTAEYYGKNKVKVGKRVKKYRKNNPGIQLKSQKKRLKMESTVFNKSSVEYIYALMCWKKVLMKRDNGCCAYCGAKGKKSHLEGHHIIYKHTEMRLALNENNGLILCRKCHDEVHKLNPIKFVRSI